jgi:signal transduction histidine kinase
MGMDSMYKRAELLNGKLSVVSKPTEGCKVELVINYNQKNLI